MWHAPTHRLGGPGHHDAFDTEKLDLPAPEGRGELRVTLPRSSTTPFAIRQAKSISPKPGRATRVSRTTLTVAVGVVTSLFWPAGANLSAGDLVVPPRLLASSWEDFADLPMTQAIAGVTPSQTQEMTVMIVWPSIARLSLGRFLGRLYQSQFGFYIFTVGNLLALLTAPLGLVLYLSKVVPGIAVRYRLTNRRVVVERGMLGVYERGVELDRFNAIDIAVLPGQAWFDAGDLVFRLDQTETFRLAGVSRPESFRRTCLKSQQSFTGIQQAVGV